MFILKSEIVNYKGVNILKEFVSDKPYKYLYSTCNKQFDRFVSFTNIKDMKKYIDNKLGGIENE